MVKMCILFYRSALQTLHKVSQKARENNFYPGGPSHDWLSFYESRIESEQSCLNEWNAMDSLESRRPPSPDAIRNKLVLLTYNCRFCSNTFVLYTLLLDPLQRKKQKELSK